MIEKALCCMPDLIVDLQCGVDVQVCICKLPNKPSYWPGAVMCLKQNATKEEPGNSWIKTGAHVMIVGSGAKMLDGYPGDAKADPTKPYVMWPGTQYEHLMLPVH